MCARLPAVALFAEATLEPMALQRVAEQMDQLLTIAPELALGFRVTLTAEGQRFGVVLFGRVAPPSVPPASRGMKDEKGGGESRWGPWPGAAASLMRRVGG